MRRYPLPLLAAALAAVLVAVSMPAGAEPVREMEWREVFSPDGTITSVYVRKEAPARPSAQEYAAAAAAGVVAIQNTGPSSTRFDLVIIGDGYTSSQMGTLRQHAQAKWDEIAATAPWNKYRDRVNVWLVEVVSSQSGVDNDPTQGISRTTALDMYFWCAGTERLLCLNESKAKQYAAQAPGVDAIVAVGNSTKYGGAGYPSLATVSGGNVDSGRVAIHELGHSVGGLADEYYTAGTTYSGGEPREPNITTSRSCAKWSSYLGRATPDGGVIGCHQGGHQYAYGIYRPSEDSLMRNHHKPFNLIGLDVMDRAIAAKISGPTPTPTTTRPTTVPPTTVPPTTTLPGSCTGFLSTYTGTLASGASAYQPNNSYYQSTVSGIHQACLDGPSGADYDLHLQKWNGSSWANVASGTTSNADETVSYSGTAGYYRYRVHAYSGSGSYTLGIRKP